MADTNVSYEVALKNAKQGNYQPKGGNAVTRSLMDGTKLEVSILKIFERDAAKTDSNPKGLKTVHCSFLNGGICQFRVVNPETDLAFLAPGTMVSIEKTSAEIVSRDRKTQEVQLNEDGSEKMQTIHFYNFVAVIPASTLVVAESATTV